ncbi:sulfotransferase [Microbispora sp. H10885]|uniref:sulfotransferase n=1 Tax=Microbispora sp. H10885 TaxID=2729110 RepID=UPI001C719EF2|nr:sulfotransferase [Microbispora sp. H10885]
MLLNSHSRIHAPHELHVRRIAVTLTTEPVRQAMEAAGHRTSDIEHILWDRLLHRELVRSGKEIVSRRRREGLVVRYERLVDDTEGELRRVCAWLGVEYEPEMIRYGDKDHGEFVKGIGDWRDKIRSGRVQRGRPLPAARCRRGGRAAAGDRGGLGLSLTWAWGHGAARPACLRSVSAPDLTGGVSKGERFSKRRPACGTAGDAG